MGIRNYLIEGVSGISKKLIARLHQTKADIPKNGILIDATAPIARVVDEIVRQCAQGSRWTASGIT